MSNIYSITLNVYFLTYLIYLSNVCCHLKRVFVKRWRQISTLSLYILPVTAMCASVFTLVAIAGDRFFAIMFPLKSRVTQRKVSVMIIIIWLAAISIGMPVLFFYSYGERQWKNFFEAYCLEVWPQIRRSDGECDTGLTSRSAYWICVLVVLNWIPMLVMMVTYTVILVRLRRSRKVARCGRLSISAIQQRSKRKVCRKPEYD